MQGGYHIFFQIFFAPITYTARARIRACACVMLRAAAAARPAAVPPGEISLSPIPPIAPCCHPDTARNSFRRNSFRVRFVFGVGPDA